MASLLIFFKDASQVAFASTTRCTCSTFWKKATCPHVASVQHARTDSRSAKSMGREEKDKERRRTQKQKGRDRAKEMQAEETKEKKRSRGAFQ